MGWRASFGGKVINCKDLGLVPSTKKLQKMDPVWISPWRVIYFGLAPFLVTCVAKVCRHGGVNSSAGFLMRCLRGSVKNIRVGREYTLLFYFNLIFLFPLFQLPVATFPFAMPSPPTALCPLPKVACRTVA